MKRVFACCTIALAFCASPVRACECGHHTFYSLEEARAADHDCVDTLMIADVDTFPDLCEFHELNFLWIRNSKFKSISPDQLECLSRLEVLKLNYGLLRTFSIGASCPALRELSLSQNKLDSIVGPFDQLTHLRVLKITNNPLKYVDIEQVLILKDLTKLSLYGEHGEPPLFTADQQAEIAGALSNCTIWFEPPWPYIRSTPAEQK